MIKTENNNSTLHEDLCTFIIMYHSILLTMRNISDKICRENENIHFMLSDFSEKRAIYKIMWENMTEPER